MKVWPPNFPSDWRRLAVALVMEVTVSPTKMIAIFLASSSNYLSKYFFMLKSRNTAERVRPVAAVSKRVGV